MEVKTIVQAGQEKYQFEGRYYRFTVQIVTRESDECKIDVVQHNGTAGAGYLVESVRGNEAHRFHQIASTCDDCG